MDVQGKSAGKEAEVGTMTGEEAGNVTEDVAHANIKAPKHKIQRSNWKPREQQRLWMIKCDIQEDEDIQEYGIQSILAKR